MAPTFRPARTMNVPYPVPAGPRIWSIVGAKTGLIPRGYPSSPVLQQRQSGPSRSLETLAGKTLPDRVTYIGRVIGNEPVPFRTDTDPLPAKPVLYGRRVFEGRWI